MIFNTILFNIKSLYTHAHAHAHCSHCFTPLYDIDIIIIKFRYIISYAIYLKLIANNYLTYTYLIYYYTPTYVRCRHYTGRVVICNRMLKYSFNDLFFCFSNQQYQKG